MNLRSERGTPPLREPTRLEKLLQLEGGAFVKRSPRSGGQIDGGWRIDAEAKTSDLRDSVVVTKTEGGQDKVRNVPVKELVRLNTGRNRGALEYLARLPSPEDAQRFMSAVDRTDQDEHAREELRTFFEHEALAKAQALVRGTPFTLKARTIDELTDELTDKLAKIEDWKMAGVRVAVKSAEEALQRVKALDANPIDPDDLQDAEHDLGAVRAQKRHLERQWNTKVSELLALLDLAQQFSK